MLTFPRLLSPLVALSGLLTACGSSGGCEDDNDCAQTEFCNAGACEPAACDNGVKDSHESDVDCGGIDCPDCPPGSDCKVNADCDSHICDPDTMKCADVCCTDADCALFGAVSRCVPSAKAGTNAIRQLHCTKP